MKRLFPVLLLALLFLQPARSQNATVDLVVFEPLPEINFAAFITANNLEGMPRIFYVNIMPPGEEVYLEGVVEWMPLNESGYSFLYSFQTNVFEARTIYNDEIGTDIIIDKDESDSDLIERNLQNNRPTGSYRISMSVYSPNGERLANDTEEITFFNPTQTLTIITPAQGSELDEGNVVASWTPVQGVAEYIIRANVRESRDQTLEEALFAGNPVIDDANVGGAVNANLREILDRQWTPGDEIVLQVSGHIPGPEGGSRVDSDIINFYLINPNSAENQALRNALINLLQTAGIPETSELLNDLMQGNIQITGAEDIGGGYMSQEDAIQILNELLSNPDNVTDIKREDD